MNGETMETLVFGLYVFVLAAFAGQQILTKVPHLLHTPLMAATNAISGISLVGSLVAAGGDHGPLATALGTIAVAAASLNVVGGFVITDRMLKMFEKKTPTGVRTSGAPSGARAGGAA